MQIVLEIASVFPKIQGIASVISLHNKVLESFLLQPAAGIFRSLQLHESGILPAEPLVQRSQTSRRWDLIAELTLTSALRWNQESLSLSWLFLQFELEPDRSLKRTAFPQPVIHIAGDQVSLQHKHRVSLLFFLYGCTHMVFTYTVYKPRNLFGREENSFFSLQISLNLWKWIVCVFCNSLGKCIHYSFLPFTAVRKGKVPLCKQSTLLSLPRLGENATVTWGSFSGIKSYVSKLCQPWNSDLHRSCGHT